MSQIPRRMGHVHGLCLTQSSLEGGQRANIASNICHKLRELRTVNKGNAGTILMRQQMLWRKVPKGRTMKHKSCGKHSGSRGGRAGLDPWLPFKGCMLFSAPCQPHLDPGSY